MIVNDRFFGGLLSRGLRDNPLASARRVDPEGGYRTDKAWPHSVSSSLIYTPENTTVKDDLKINLHRYPVYSPDTISSGSMSKPGRDETLFLI